jgi:hypothetical protein
MKTIINKIWAFLEAFGQARAAASLARMGDVAGAKAIYK